MTAKQLEVKQAREVCHLAWKAYRKALRDKTPELDKLRHEYAEKRTAYLALERSNRQ